MSLLKRNIPGSR